MRGMWLQEKKTSFFLNIIHPVWVAKKQGGMFFLLGWRNLGNRHLSLTGLLDGKFVRVRSLVENRQRLVLSFLRQNMEGGFLDLWRSDRIPRVCTWFLGSRALGNVGD